MALWYWEWLINSINKTVFFLDVELLPPWCHSEHQFGALSKSCCPYQRCGDGSGIPCYLPPQLPDHMILFFFLSIFFLERPRTLPAWISRREDNRCQRCQVYPAQAHGLNRWSIIWAQGVLHQQCSTIWLCPEFQRSSVLFSFLVCWNQKHSFLPKASND